MRIIEFPVLVIGGGVAGLSAGLELARRGIASLVIEKDSRLGGHVKGFCCKAADHCVHCGACRLGDLLAEVGSRPRLSLLTRALPVAARQVNGGWEVELAPQPGFEDEPLGEALDEPATVRCRSVILALGHTPFDPARKSSLGYGRVPGVMSGHELEAMLSQGVLVGPDGSAPQSLAFIQCVGSRDKSLGNLYCSRVCCGYALNLAAGVRGLLPESQISFFHMDVQNYGPGWEEDLARMRDEIRFVRAMPGEVFTGSQGPELVYAGPDQKPVSESFDLVVLSVGLTPPAGASEMAGMFAVSRTNDGFLGIMDDDCQGGAPGVFVAGAARGPRSIVESIDHAALAAARAGAFLGERGKEAAHA